MGAPPQSIHNCGAHLTTIVRFRLVHYPGFPTMQPSQFRTSRTLLGLTALVLSLGCVGDAAFAADFVSTKPAARVEHWQRREAEINAYVRDSKDLKNVKLLFVGDSITDFWLFDDNPCFVPHPAKGQRRTRATRFARPESGIHRGADWHQQHLGRRKAGNR